MAVPARAAADSQEPAVPGPRRDPAAPRWAEILTTEIMAMRRAVEDLARDPGSGRALETAMLNLAVAERLGELARQETFKECELDAVYAQGYDDGVAACMAARCRLELIQGGG